MMLRFYCIVGLIMLNYKGFTTKFFWAEDQVEPTNEGTPCPKNFTTYQAKSENTGSIITKTNIISNNKEENDSKFTKDKFYKETESFNINP